MKKLLPTHNSILASILIVLASLYSPDVFGQMFSIRPGESRQVNIQDNFFITFAIEAMDFEFQGDRALIVPPGRLNDVGFDSEVYRVGFESPFVSASLGVAGKVTGLDDIRYINLDIGASTPGIFFGSQRFGLSIPINFGFDVTSARSDKAEDDFEQATFSIGTAANLSFRPSTKFRVQAGFGPGIGASLARGGFFGGQMVSLTSKNRIIVGNLIAGKSLLLGYDYKFKDFDIEGSRFDFEATSHSFTIGLAF